MNRCGQGVVGQASSLSSSTGKMPVPLFGSWKEGRGEGDRPAKPPGRDGIEGAPRRVTARACTRALALFALLAFVSAAGAEVLFETTTPHHNIRVVDENGRRTLEFDSTTQSRMNLRDSLTGHFEYTELFHMPWLWNARLTNVLMVGLGGASTQRSFEHYYSNVVVETVEIDPVVVKVAKDYFHYVESPRQQVRVEDGRVFLRRSTKRYDLILMDAYTENRYGGMIPQHLATKEFFELAASHLTTNGVLAYNVMGTLHGWQADLVGSMYKTLKTVFPQVYLFPAVGSWNVILVATKSPQSVDLSTLRQRAAFLQNQHRITLPTFNDRVSAFHANAPPSATRAPVLTDDYAPVEGLMNVAGRGTKPKADKE
jgi:spermidine synthase